MPSKRHQIVPPKSLEIKQDDKFFTRIMTKENSMANSSCRIYYGGSSGAIPFMWESTPGTPKHTALINASVNPPLTPPPSYYSTPKSKSVSKKSFKRSLMSSIFPRLVTPQNGKKNTHHVSPSSSMSSTTTSSSSSSLSSFYYSSSPSTLKNSKKYRDCSSSSSFSCSRSPIHDYTVNGEEEEDDDEMKWPTSRLCYGGCYLMKNMKTAFLSIVGHGSG